MGLTRFEVKVYDGRFDFVEVLQCTHGLNNHCSCLRQRERSHFIPDVREKPFKQIMYVPLSRGVFSVVSVESLSHCHRCTPILCRTYQEKNQLVGVQINIRRSISGD